MVRCPVCGTRFALGYGHQPTLPQQAELLHSVYRLRADAIHGVEVVRTGRRARAVDAPNLVPPRSSTVTGIWERRP